MVKTAKQTKVKRSRVQTRTQRRTRTQSRRTKRSRLSSSSNFRIKSPLASVYIKTKSPSEKRMTIKFKRNFKTFTRTIKPRLKRSMTLKGGFTRWQVENQSIGIGPLKKGKLEGWHASETKASRLKSVDKAVRKFGALSTYRSLNALAVLGKNRQPEVASVAKEDRDYVRKRYFSH